MKLHSAPFESRLRSRVRQAVRQDPVLRRQWQRAPRIPAVRQTGFRVTFRILVSLALAAGVYASANGGLPRAVQAATGALWLLASALILRQHILNTFYRTDYLAAFTVLPTPPELVVRWNSSKVAGLAWRTGLDALAVLVAIALTNEAGTGGWLAILPFGALLTVLVHALALWLVFVPIPPFVNLLPGVGVGAAMVVANVPVLRDWLLRFAAEHSGTIGMALPGGWVLRPYAALLASDHLELLALLIPAIGLAASFPWARRRLIRVYSPFDFALWHVFRVPPVEYKAAFDACLADQPAAPGVTEITDSLHDREFLAPGFQVDSRRWIERRVLAWLTPRERSIIELAFFNLPRWTRTALIGSALLAAAVTVAAVAKRIPDSHLAAMAAWASGMCGIVGGLLCLPLGAGFKRVLQPVNLGGILIPFGAVFPVTMQELMRMAIKASIVRGAFILPSVLICGGLLGLALKISPIWPIIAGVKLVFLSIAWTPMLQAVSQSYGTNDTSNVTIRSLLVMAVFVVGMVGFVGFGIGGIFLPLPWSVGCLILAPGVSVGVAALYSEIHARRTFDLMARPKG